MQPPASAAPARPGRPQLLLFAFGDFAFNLYWQSVMLFLLYYYTDAIGLPIHVAATIYLIASVWDGIANFLAGMIIDRRADRINFGRLIAVGAIPIGLCFILTYFPPPTIGLWGVALVLGAHILFRTAYAGLNVPYLAMSARISAHPHDRSFVAGARMMFGTAAAVVVALATVQLGAAITGSSGARAFFGAALVFASLGAVILIVVGLAYRDAVRPPPPGQGWGTTLTALARNRAFVALNIATMAMIVAVTVLGKSVLYYFKYLLNDPAAGQLALAAMGIVSGIAIPLWMLIGRRIGLRRLWLVATGFGMAGLTFFAAVELRTPIGMQTFLVGMQVVIVGLNFVFWSLLPNTIEYGERTTGVHVEGAVFGVAALLQRIAIGIATAILGYGFASAGYVPNVQQSAETLHGMRLTAALVPLAFLAVSYVAMLFCPIGRRTAANPDDEQAMREIAPI
ncbi:MFS transporter [Sphingomonas sabuli]|uniref:MFS transporter n=1 Tax=Sphingomonas sabuli TaxID=2764186 RepID=A0A7G9KZT7_9SPHN|nr:MFS transporter [Sphingomonas sabuli]QNM81886.1 MFS transporter [Sphingomonas sabuli]